MKLSIFPAVAAAAAAFAFACPQQARADYPERNIKIIVPFSAGGFSDSVARLVAEGISSQLKASVVVENKPGAGGNLGAAIAARAEPDGYTLFLGNVATNAVNPNIYRNLEIDPAKAFVPVSLVVKTPNLVAVNNDLPVKSIKELVELATKEPGKLNYGTPGTGTSGHMTGEMFKSRAGVDIVHIPYKGTPPALADLMGGQLQVTFDNVTSLAPHANAHRIRPLAVSSKTRSPLLPDVPTLAEAGYPGFEATSWAGIVAPAGTPQAIVDMLNQAINKTISTDAFKQKMNGGEVTPMSPAAFGEFIAADRKQWGEVAQRIGLTLQ